MAMTISVVVMAMIQKLKTLSFITKEEHIFLLNFILSFLIGIPFSVTFFDTSIINGIWISLFSFIGAPSIYSILKNQKIINYKPTSLDDKLTETSQEVTDQKNEEITSENE